MEAPVYAIDKSTWGDGPWQSEPDKMQWQDAETGLPCLIVRAPVTGALCGYVGVTKDHPGYGLSYDGTPQEQHDAYHKALRAKLSGPLEQKDHDGVGRALTELERPEPDANGQRLLELDAHGGLTYSGECSGHICHVPEPGAPDDVWWFGFDCAHAFDLSPAMNALMRELDLETPKPAIFAAALERVRASEVYRDVAYVQAECAGLARQLKAMAG